MSEPKRTEVEMRDKAIMHQQRRLKQATQFSHKDSADLLPLDGLKRLGTSKDLQPHSIVQRRLLEGNIPRLARETRDTPSRVRSPLADSKEASETEERSKSTPGDSSEELESPKDSERSLRSEEEEDEDQDVNIGQDMGKTVLKHKWMEMGSERVQAGTEGGRKAPGLSALWVQCKCDDAELKVSINTGCQFNHISRTCCRRLGLKSSSNNEPSGGSTADPVTSLHLQFGKEILQCSAQVVDDDAVELSLGLQTLLELRCCIDLNTRVIRLCSIGEQLPFLETPEHGQCHLHDNNRNL